MNRRKFLKTTGLTLGATAINPCFLLSSVKPQNKASLDYILYDEYPWPYDKDCMGSAERIVFDNNNTAWINVFAKPGKNLDIRLYSSDTEQNLYRNLPQEFTGVKDSHDMPVGDMQSPRLFYKIEFREGKNPWKSHAPREVKTPNVDLEKAEKLKIIMIGDDHLYADLKFVPRDEKWRKDVLTGDYVSRMLKEIINDPNYEPEVRMREIVQGYSYAWTLKYILEARPDLVIALGDTVGTDSYNVWGGEKQWPNELQPKDALEKQAKTLWERTRRILAPITPEIPFYLVSGNHDGENGWEPYTDYSIKQRKRLFKLPKFKPVHFTPVRPSPVRTSLSTIPNNPDNSNDPNDREFSLYPEFEFEGNHYSINWAKGDVKFIVLTPLSYVFKKPAKVTDWTLGETQKKTFENCLQSSYRVPWKFICFHHTVGGYPLGPDTHPGAYARGPLYTREDYEKANEMAKIIDHNAVFNPDKVEQVWITELAKEYNARGFFYGHDHVFFLRSNNHKPIGKTSLNNEMISACVGSTNYVAGNEYQNIWHNPYWMEFYGYFYKNPPPFWTQPGITELEIDKDKAIIRYVCTAPIECMHSNMPVGTRPGDILREYTLFKEESSVKHKKNSERKIIY